MRIAWILATALALVTGTALWRVAFAADSQAKDPAYEDLASDEPATRAACLAGFVDKGSSAVDDLLKSLETEPAPLIKAGIGSALRSIGLDDEKVLGLRSALKAADPVTRLEAVRIAAGTSPGALRSELEAALVSGMEVHTVRACAALALGRCGNSAHDALAKAVADPTLGWQVRKDAIRGLALTGSTGAKDVAALVDPASQKPQVVEAALGALAQPGASATGALLDLTESSNASVVAGALGVLVARGESGDDTIEALVSATGHDDATVRFQALRGIVALGKEAQEKDAVKDRLQDEDLGVRLTAIEAAGVAFAASPTDVVETLKGSLTSTEFMERYLASLSLLALGDRSGGSVMDQDKSSEEESQAAMAKSALDKISAQ